jgi:hypothetical protein
VAVAYSIAIATSMLGPWFSRTVHRRLDWGLTPTLVFGTLLLATLPLVLIVNAGFWPATIALSLSVVGSAIIGYGQGLLARKLMGEQQRRTYFLSMGLLIAGPYLLLVPAGSWIAAAYGMPALFLLIFLGLAIVVAPLYFYLVFLTSRQRL